jgi:hypothetical protein
VASRLLTVQTRAVGVGQVSHSYAYNAIGNLTRYGGASYSHNGAQPHAATARGNAGCNCDAAEADCDRQPDSAR